MYTHSQSISCTYIIRKILSDRHTQINHRKAFKVNDILIGLFNDKRTDKNLYRIKIQELVIQCSRNKIILRKLGSLEMKSCFLVQHWGSLEKICPKKLVENSYRPATYLRGRGRRLNKKQDQLQFSSSTFVDAKQGQFLMYHYSIHLPGLEC